MESVDKRPRYKTGDMVFVDKEDSVIYGHRCRISEVITHVKGSWLYRVVATDMDDVFNFDSAFEYDISMASP